jgi:hypothetical protein
LPAASAAAYCPAHFNPHFVMSNQSPDHSKRNWPLIWTGVIVGLLVTASVVGLVAMYVANFNLLEWME